MWEAYVPVKRIGTLAPLSTIENEAYEFYRIAPQEVMSIYLPLGLQKFSAADVERVFGPIDNLIGVLLDRDVDIIVQSGVPLPLLIGVAAHNRLMEHIAAKSGLPVTSSVTAVVDAARQLGIRNIALANKWSEQMNGVLGEFFDRRNIKVAGVCSDSMTPDIFLKMSTRNGMDLAYELGSRAIRENPGCDGLYIGGGAWLSLPVCEHLEREFGLPCISNQDAVLWDCLHKVDYWKPIRGSNRLLAGD